MKKCFTLENNADATMCYASARRSRNTQSSPRLDTVAFVRQFARAYAPVVIKGVDFPGMVLN